MCGGETRHTFIVNKLLALEYLVILAKTFSTRIIFRVHGQNIYFVVECYTENNNVLCNALYSFKFFFDDVIMW